MASHWLGFFSSFEQYETELVTKVSKLSWPKQVKLKIVATIKFMAASLASESESSSSYINKALLQKS
jgi:hypothetical protein